MAAALVEGKPESSNVEEREALSNASSKIRQIHTIDTYMDTHIFWQHHKQALRKTVLQLTSSYLLLRIVKMHQFQATFIIVYKIENLLFTLPIDGRNSSTTTDGMY